MLNGKDTLALLPTGGGKSICFQLPGLALGGTTLVISPLVALMNDQVDNLKQRGISAVAITAAMNYKQIQISLNNASMGHVQFLYISPERLQNEDFRMQLSHLPITLIAVDEAHCISQWGYDFRPSYMKIAEVRAYFDKVPIIAVTASATKEVIKDIQARLEFKDQNVFHQSFLRSNLRYVVQLEENKLDRLLKLVQNIGGSGIVYVRNRRKTEEVSKLLQQKNFTAKAYHAGLKYDDRRSIQDDWINNRTQIICATNAFGMGIDKPDVRFVVHLDLTDSIEAYFQEAGRAGRNGKTAYSTIFFNKRDEQRLLDNFEYAFPTLEQIKQTYQAIGNYFQIAIGAGEGTSVDLDIELLCKSYNLHPIIVYNSIKFLEKQNYLSLFDAGFEPSKVMVLSNKENLYEYQMKNPSYEPLIKTLLRNYGGLFENYVFINEKDLVYKVKLGFDDIMKQLQLLHSFKIISYIPQSNLPKLIFMQGRIDAKHIELDPENYAQLKHNHHKRIHGVINYVNNDKVCRQVQLLTYFNEFNNADCGYCDVCLSKKPKDYDKVKHHIIEVLKSKTQTIEEMKVLMTKYHSDTWIKAFNELIDDGVIKMDKDQYLLS
ncbi:MAG: RecQ family ATP-dependent DNA helicase [Sphingobacteriaceae bacterium]|nr:RecQ family ATP-dependent DNA helicase [Sphingobacteriaceae bacterium]